MRLQTRIALSAAVGGAGGGGAVRRRCVLPDLGTGLRPPGPVPVHHRRPRGRGAAGSGPRRPGLLGAPLSGRARGARPGPRPQPRGDARGGGPPGPDGSRRSAHGGARRRALSPPGALAGHGRGRRPAQRGRRAAADRRRADPGRGRPRAGPGGGRGRPDRDEPRPADRARRAAPPDPGAAGGGDGRREPGPVASRARGARRRDRRAGAEHEPHARPAGGRPGASARHPQPAAALRRGRVP